MSKKYTIKKILFILCYLLLSIKIFAVHAAPPDPELVLGMDEEEKALFTQCYDQLPYSKDRFPLLWEQIESNNKKAFTSAFLNLKIPYDRFEFLVFLDTFYRNQETKKLNKYIVFASELVELGKLCNCDLPSCSFATHFLQKDKAYQENLICLPTQIPKKYRKSFLKFLPNGNTIASFLDWFPKVDKQYHEDFVHFFPEINPDNIEDLAKALPLIKPEDKQDCILLSKKIYCPENFPSQDLDLKNHDGYSKAFSYFFTLYPYIDKDNKNAFARVISGLRGESNAKSNFDILQDIFHEQHNNKECINKHIALVANLLKEGGIYRCNLINSSFDCFLKKDETQQNDFICLLKKIPKKHREIYFNLLPDETATEDFPKLSPALNEAQIIDFAKQHSKINKEDRDDFVRFFSEINLKNIEDFVTLLPLLTPEDRNDFIMLYKEVCIAGKFCKPSYYDDRDKYSETLRYFFTLFPDINKDNRNTFANVFSNLGAHDTSNKKDLLSIVIENSRKKEKNNGKQCLNEYIVSVLHLLEHGEICQEQLDDNSFSWFLQENKEDQENYISFLRTTPKIYRVESFKLFCYKGFSDWFPKIKEEDQLYFIRCFRLISSKNLCDFVESLPFLKPDARKDLRALYRYVFPMRKPSDKHYEEDPRRWGKGAPDYSDYYRNDRYEIMSYFFKIFPYMDKQNRKNFYRVFNYLHFDNNVDFFKFIIKTYEDSKDEKRINNYISSVFNLFSLEEFHYCYLNFSSLINFIQKNNTEQEDFIRQLAEIPEKDDKKAFFNSLANINQENKDVAKPIALCDTAPVAEEIP